MNNENTIEVIVIHSIFHAPTIIIANAKYPKPWVLPCDCLMLNKNIPPASPATALDNNTATHWYFFTLIDCASTANGFSPTARYLKPTLVFFFFF